LISLGERKTEKGKSESMNRKFDDLTKNLAQSVTRRQALKKFGIGLAGMALACLGLPNRTGAATGGGFCQVTGAFYTTDLWYTGICMNINGCVGAASSDCPANGTFAGSGFSSKNGGKFKQACGYLYNSGKKCSFTV
jgi:hypothetical protein